MWIWIRDPKSLWPWIRDGKIRIRIHSPFCMPCYVLVSFWDDTVQYDLFQLQLLPNGFDDSKNILEFFSYLPNWLAIPVICLTIDQTILAIVVVLFVLIWFRTGSIWIASAGARVCLCRKRQRMEHLLPPPGWRNSWCRTSPLPLSHPRLRTLRTRRPTEQARVRIY
jgi:hypothetical protein